MTLLEFVHGLIRDGGEDSTVPFWRTIQSAQRALKARDVNRAESILASINEPAADLERFALCLMRLGIAFSAGDVPRALQYCAELEQLELYREPLAQAVADQRIGITLRMSGQYDEALARQFAARARYDSYGRSLESAICMTEIAATLLSRGDVAGATSAYLSSLDVIEREGGEAEIVGVRVNLATALHRSGNVKEAERLYLQALEVGRFATPNAERAMLLQNLAVIAKNDGRFAIAAERYSEALACVEGRGLTSQRIRLMYGLANLAIQTKDYDSAKRCLADIGAIDSKSIPVDLHAAAASSLAQIAAIENDFVAAAVHLSEARTIARDAGLLTERHDILAEALTYVQDPALRLELLEELVDVQNTRMQAVPSSVRSIIDLRAKYEQERAELEAERQQERLRLIIDTQNRMLEEVGRNLHDSIGQELTVLNMLINQAAEATSIGDSAHASAIVAKAAMVSERVYSSTRQLSHLLTGVGITGPGLEAALRELAADIMSASGSCSVETVINGDLTAIDDDVARTLYRLYQTLTQNILRHAHASRCILQLLVRPDAIVASVEDDGVGYDQHTVERGLGTRELFARAEYVGGTARIDTAPGHGTFVEIVIQRRMP